MLVPNGTYTTFIKVNDMKKRKLNSKNPKYMDKSQLTTKEVIKRVLIKDVRGVKVYGVWYK